MKTTDQIWQCEAQEEAECRNPQWVDTRAPKLPQWCSLLKLNRLPEWFKGWLYGNNMGVSAVTQCKQGNKLKTQMQKNIIAELINRCPRRGHVNRHTRAEFILWWSTCTKSYEWRFIHMINVVSLYLHSFQRHIGILVCYHYTAHMLPSSAQASSTTVVCGIVGQTLSSGGIGLFGEMYIITSQSD